MAERSDHLARARANRDFVEQLLILGDADGGSTAREWAVVAAFYAAVHFMEAHLAFSGLHSRSHADRDNLLIHVGVPPDIYAAYKMLKDSSESVRYYLDTYSTDWVRSVAVEKYLRRIERFVGE